MKKTLTTKMEQFKKLYQAHDDWGEAPGAVMELFGGYNDFPPNWKSITEAEFTRSLFFIYNPAYREHRYMFGKKDQSYTSAILFFFFDGTGVGMSSDQKTGKVSYYHFALCNHKYQEMTSKQARSRGIPHMGSCYHVEECRLCGHINTYDSSG